MYGVGAGYYDTINEIIIDKYYSINSDTIFYVKNGALKSSGYAIPTTMFYYVDTIFYTNLDSLVNQGVIDSVFYDSSRFNGRKTHRDTNSYYDLYADSLGKVYDLIYFEISTLIINEKRLIYYKKGNEEWGNPFILSIE